MNAIPPGTAPSVRLEILAAAPSPVPLLRLFSGFQVVDGVQQRRVEAVGAKSPYGFVFLELSLHYAGREPMKLRFQDLRVTTPAGEDLETFGMMEWREDDPAGSLMVRSKNLTRDLDPALSPLRQVLVVSAPFTDGEPPTLRLNYGGGPTLEVTPKPPA